MDAGDFGPIAINGNHNTAVAAGDTEIKAPPGRHQMAVLDDDQAHDREMFFPPQVVAPDVEHFPTLLHNSNNSNNNNYQHYHGDVHTLFAGKPLDKWTKSVLKVKYIASKLVDTEKANVFQITFITFCFYFYNGILTLPSVDIIRKEMGEKDLLFYTSTLFMISGILCFISSTIIGTLSDKLGRKPFLVLSTAVLLVPIIFLVLKRYMFALYLSAFSYILMAGPTIAYIAVADVTTNENRDTGYGYVSSAFPLGGILGPFVSLLLYKSPFKEDALSLTSLSLFLLGLILCLLFYIIYIVPEPLSDETKNKTQINLKRLNPFSNMIDSLFDKRLFVILFVSMLITIPQEAIQSTCFVFFRTYLGFSNFVCALLIAQTALFASFVLAVLMDKMIGLMTHRYVLFLTISVQFFALVVSAFAKNLFMLILNGFLMSFAYTSYPTILSYTSQYAEPTKQGTVLGAITGIRQLLFAAVPMLVYLLNKFADVNFGHLVDESRILISPAYLIVGILNLVSLPFLFYLEPINLI